MKLLLLFSTCVVFSFSSLQAQGSLADLRSDLASYHSENIRPTMCERRDVLEADISGDDRSRLEELREAMAALPRKIDRNQRDNLLTKSWIDYPAARATFRRSRGLSSSDIKDLEALAAKYFDRIDEILTPIHEEKLLWDAERLAIRQSYFPNCCKAAGKGKVDRKKVGIYQKASFLLKPATTEMPLPASDVRMVQLFPNPAGFHQQIKFEVKKSGPVYVDLIDRHGNLMQRVFDGVLGEGEHQFDVNLYGVRSKFLSYRIADGSGVTTTPTIRE